MINVKEEVTDLQLAGYEFEDAIAMVRAEIKQENKTKRKRISDDNDTIFNRLIENKKIALGIV